MTAAHLAVLLVDDRTAAPAAQTLCGRPSVDWLLDTVSALGPDIVTLAGSDCALAERVAAYPALAGLAPTGLATTTLVLRCSVPLVRLDTLRRAVGLLRSQTAGAVVVESAAEESWWAPAGPGTVAAVALAGPVDDLPAGLGGASPAVVRRRLAAAGLTVRTGSANAVESLCLNHPAERVRAETALYQRIAVGWLASGVLIDDPASTRIDATVHIGEGARIRPYTELVGSTVIGARSQIGPTTTVRDSLVGADCVVRYAVCQDVEVGDQANIGPYCWLRSGSRLGARARAGAFVEVADSVVGEDTSVPHLGGLISADVGRGCNVAGLSAPANFDGTRKHRVRIGDHVSIGAGTILVANAERS